jgi:hypothetical protein
MILPEDQRYPVLHIVGDQALSPTTDHDDLPPGIALLYAPEHDQATPQPTSSVYSEPPVTPSSRFRRSYSYRSYSGRIMYSPVNFPTTSSPYGTPTIRKVRMSDANLLAATGDDAEGKDDHGKTWLTDTKIAADMLDRLDLQDDIQAASLRDN